MTLLILLRYFPLLGSNSRGTKEKGAPKNNLKENDIGRDEECWDWMGLRPKISPGQTGLARPRASRMLHWAQQG